MFLYQLLINIILFIFSLVCLTVNRNSLITTLMCIELILLRINLVRRIPEFLLGSNLLINKKRCLFLFQLKFRDSLKDNMSMNLIQQ
jgi:uncharacterized membrane-anchored protein YitT (DUF2179 family)